VLNFSGTVVLKPEKLKSAVVLLKEANELMKVGDYEKITN
jgi:hypothetical protein